ncbi:hypothetical protein QBC36DRAFT_335331 [Triangularia setosa]|uniref:Uncharacterized protein n=1 Tax=Triangularia setosa TaxID=2587417 RepID=A0AAN6W2D2_9PEZI|nr:hypothetical protein QBC36DRAFT_335331 [Podospora setosa]
MAYSIIRDSIEPVIDILQASGFDENNNGYDPKSLWDLIHRVIPKISEEAWHILQTEMTDISVKNFDSLRTFLTRFHWLRRKLQDLGQSVPEKMLLTIVLRVVKPYDENWVESVKLLISTGNVDYLKLMDLLEKKAN